MSKDVQEPIYEVKPDGTKELVFKGIDKRLAMPLAFLGTIGAPLGDLLPGGDGKKKVVEGVFKGLIDDIVEAGVKTTDDASSLKFFKEAGVDDDIAQEAAPLLTAAKDKKTAETVIRDTAAKQMQIVEKKTATRIEEITDKQKGKALSPDGSKIDVPPQILTADELDELAFLKKNKNKPANIIAAERAYDYKEGKLADEMDSPLAQEARKYKSAEEFVNRSGGENVYHGGSLSGEIDVAKGERGFYGKGFYVTDTPEIASKYNKNVSELKLNPSRIVERNAPLSEDFITKFDSKFDAPDAYTYGEAYNHIAKLKGEDVATKFFAENGVDGWRVKSPTGLSDTSTSITVFNKDALKTKSQLTDIYNTANKNIRQVAETKALDTARGAERNRGYITSAKASDQISQDVAREISETYTQKSNKELVDKAVQRVDSNIDEAKKFANENSTDEAVATRITIDKKLSADYEAATTAAEKEAIAEELTDSLIKHARLATEEGRAVQANALLGKTTPEGMLRTTSGAIDKYNKTAKTKIPQITPKDVKEVLDEGNKIGKMPEGLAKEVAKKKLADKLKSLVPSSFWKKVVNVWKAGLLTGIKTSGVNISSNFFNGLAENIKNIPATGVDLASSIFTGTRTKALNLRGLGQGTKEGVKKGWDYLKTGVSEESAKSGLEFDKVHFDSVPGKVLEKYAEGVYRILGTEDMPFFYGALRRSLGEQALVAIKNEKKVFANSAERSKFIQDYIDNPSKEALELADIDAKVATFRNDTALGKMATSIQHSGGALSQIVLPFAKTPSAVATAMFNYTPAGALMAVYENFIKGKFDQKKFAEAMGRSVTGFGALWLGSELYKKGKMTLGYPTEEKEKAEWEATGKTPNSILIEGKWVPLVTFGPAGSVLGIGGYVDRGKEETGSLAGGVKQGLFGGAKQLTEQTFLVGVGELIDTIKDPQKNAKVYTNRVAGSIVPTIISDVAQALDEYQRKPVGAGDAIKARIPGVRTTVAKKLDVWGQPMERNRTAIGTAISPFRLSNTIEGKLNTEVERMKELGEDIRPTKVDPRIKEVKLDDKEFYKFQRIYGLVLTKSLTALIESEQYQNLDPEDQAEMWKKVVSDVRKGASDVALPVLLKKRYGFGDEVNNDILVTLVNTLYKKSPDFAKASPEKQKKVIVKLLGSTSQ